MMVLRARARTPNDDMTIFERKCVLDDTIQRSSIDDLWGTWFVK